MLPATASAPAPDPAALHAAYLGHLRRTGRGNTAYWTAARTFFARWPDPAAWAAEPLDVRLSANGVDPAADHVPDAARAPAARLRLPAGTQALQPLAGAGRLPSRGRPGPVPGAAARAGLPATASQVAIASQVPARLLIQTGRRLDQLTTTDLEEFAAACADRQQRTGKGWWHYKAALSNTQRVLFHLQILPEPPGTGGPASFPRRLAGITPEIADAMTAYLERRRRPAQPRTVSSLATRLDALRPVPHPDRSRARYR